MSNTLDLSTNSECELCNLVGCKLNSYFLINNEITFNNKNDMDDKANYKFIKQATGVVLHEEKCILEESCTCTKLKHHKLVSWTDFQKIIAHQYSIHHLIRCNFNYRVLKCENQETCSYNCFDGDWRTREAICNQVGLNQSDLEIDEYKIIAKKDLQKDRIIVGFLNDFLLTVNSMENICAIGCTSIYVYRNELFKCCCRS
jgi:hypothetical protein